MWHTVAHRGRENADDVLVAALAGGATVAKAAELAGVAPRTVWRRLQDDAFHQRLDTARQQTIQAAVDMLGKAASAATMTLIDLLQSKHPPSARLGAARAILELGAKLREGQEVEERLTAIEAALSDIQRRRPA